MSLQHNSKDTRPVVPRKKALGRGLGALIPGGAARTKREFFQCPIARIKPTRDQPRQHFDEAVITELATSLKHDGVIQPLVVRQDGADYRLIAGERRWRAAQLAGLTSVPVVIKDVDEDRAFELALVENIQRQDLNPLEEAEAYRRIMEARGCTQTELAARVGKSRPAVANVLRLLGLHADVQQTVAAGQLKEGAARALLALPSPEHQVELASAVVDEGFTVRQVESLVKRVCSGMSIDAAVARELAPAVAETSVATSAAPRKRASKAKSSASRRAAAESAQVRNLREELQRVLGARVAIHDDGGSGSIEIFFDDYANLDSILDRIQGPS